MPEELEWEGPKLLPHYIKFTPLVIFFAAIKLARVELSFPPDHFSISKAWHRVFTE